MKPSVLRSGKALCLYLALCFCLLCTCAGADSFNGYTSSVITVGSSVSFGHYEQDGSWQNGSEPIVWDVLDIDGDSALLISRKLLDCVQYHSRETAVAWGNSDIRWWLNSSFYQNAFNESEKSCIIQSLVSGTLDYVFLPNRNQVLSYGLCDTGCDTTPYAAGRGVQIGQSTGKGCWWVRMDVTHANGNAQFVGTRGNVYDTNRVTIGNNGVRPCIVASVYALQSGGYSTGSSATPVPQQNTGYYVTGTTKQKLATRCGPSTDYDETHTYNLGVGTQVRVLRYEVTRGTAWVEVEFKYGGEWVRAWTGKKRIDCAEAVNLSGDYRAQGSGYVSRETPGWFGPGSDYRILYTSVASGTYVDILSSSGSWYLIGFMVPGSKLIHRAWVPKDRISK
jgi:hypothetical protein